MNFVILYLIMIFRVVVLSTYSLEMISGQNRSIMVPTGDPDDDDPEDENAPEAAGEEEEDPSQMAMVAFQT